MDINLTAPKTWQQLTDKEVLFVASLFSKGDVSEAEFKLKCLFEFTGLRPYIVPQYWFKKAEKKHSKIPNIYIFKGKKYIIEDFVIFEFAEQMNFLLEQPGIMACQQKIAGFFRTDNLLYSTTFEEYLMADRYYRAYSKSKNDTFLCSMIAILYRKKRQKYRDSLIKKNTAKIRRLATNEQKYAVFLWWTGLKLWLKEKYSSLFGNQNSNEINFGNTEEDDDDSNAIMNMLFAITEGRAYENEKVYKTPVHEVLHALNQKAKNISEINSKIK